MRLLTIHPEINWALNGPEDDWNAQSWVYGHDIKAKQPYLDVLLRTHQPSKEAVWNALHEVGNCKSHAIRYAPGYKSMEHRYFDAPADLNELYHQVAFAEAISMYAQRNLNEIMRYSNAKYPRPRALAREGKLRCLDRFLSFVDDIGLSPLDYAPLAKPRFDIRWWDGTAT